METDGGVEKQRTVFPHLLAKRCCVSHSFHRLGGYPTKTTKPDRSFATKTGHFYLLPTQSVEAVYDRRKLQII
jgi:hypothetical protein